MKGAITRVSARSIKISHKSCMLNYIHIVTYTALSTHINPKKKHSCYKMFRH